MHDWDNKDDKIESVDAIDCSFSYLEVFIFRRILMYLSTNVIFVDLSYLVIIYFIIKLIGN